MIVLDPDQLNRLFATSGEFFLDEKYRYINVYLQERTDWICKQLIKEGVVIKNDETLKSFKEKVSQFVKRKYDDIKQQ